MAEYMVINNNIIEAVYCGDVESNENTIILPENHQVRVGENISFYNDDWSRKSDVELILLGLIDVPQGYKVENNQLVELTYEEKVIAGLEALPPYYKIENNALVEMQEHEKLTLMTKEEKAQYHRKKRDSLLNAELWKLERHSQEKALGVDTTITEQEYIALLQYIQALRELPQQAGFPDTVTYPEKS